MEIPFQQLTKAYFCTISGKEQKGCKALCCKVSRTTKVYKNLLKYLLFSAALANRERWYKPPVVREIEEEVEEEEEGEGEEEEEEGGEAEEEEEESLQPPSKKANVEVDDGGKGALPGSHPGNVKKY